MEPKHTKKMLLRQVGGVGFWFGLVWFGGEVFCFVFLFFIFIFFKKSFTCLFTAALGLCYCAQAFSSRGSGGG